MESDNDISEAARQVRKEYGLHKETEFFERTVDYLEQLFEAQTSGALRLAKNQNISFIASLLTELQNIYEKMSEVQLTKSLDGLFFTRAKYKLTELKRRLLEENVHLDSNAAKMFYESNESRNWTSDVAVDDEEVRGKLWNEVHRYVGRIEQQLLDQRNGESDPRDTMPSDENSVMSTPPTSDKTMSVPSRDELDAKLQTIEAKMDARVASIEGKIDSLLVKIDERDKAAVERSSRLETDLGQISSDTKNFKLWLAGLIIPTAVASVLAIAAFNGTLLSNMLSAFEAGKNTATALIQATEQIKQTQDELKAIRERLEKR